MLQWFPKGQVRPDLPDFVAFGYDFVAAAFGNTSPQTYCSYQAVVLLLLGRSIGFLFPWEW